jgi:hypothetical protein
MSAHQACNNMCRPYLHIRNVLRCAGVTTPCTTSAPNTVPPCICPAHICLRPVAAQQLCVCEPESCRSGYCVGVLNMPTSKPTLVHRQSTEKHTSKAGPCCTTTVQVLIQTTVWCTPNICKHHTQTFSKQFRWQHACMQLMPGFFCLSLSNV